MSIGISTLLMGQLAAVLVWLALQLLNKSHDRHKSYRDTPALGFRLFSILIEPTAYYGRRLMPERYLTKLEKRLSQAGVEYSVDAQQFVAAKCVSLVLLGCIGAALTRLMFADAWLVVLAAAVLGWRYPDIWLARLSKRRQRQIINDLPFYLDVITLSVESGSNVTSGLMQAIRRTAHSPLRQDMIRVLQEIRAGKMRAHALTDFAERTAEPIVINIVAGIVQAERSGASLGPMLRAQAQQLRSQRFQRAEKQAMEAPVKLLAPLFTFIFPTTFVVLGYLMVSKAIREGVLTWAPVVWAYYWPGVK